MISIVWSIVAFVFALGLLIAFHEFGHFWVARRLGIKVLRFSVGFGRPLWCYQAKSGTEYVLAAVPIGGYVKMLDEAEGVVKPSEQHLAFNRKSVWIRMAVVIAGPLFNIILALLFYWLMFVIGVTGVAAVINTPPPGSVAALAGLQKGDEIVQVGAKPVSTWYEAKLALVSHLGNRYLLPITAKKQSLSHLTREPSSVTKLSEIKQTYTLNLSQWKVNPKQPRLLLSLGLLPYRPPVTTKLARVLPGTPAAKAGLKPGDTIIAVNDVKVTYWHQLTREINAFVGKRIELTLRRDHKIIKISVIPEARESKQGQVRGYLGIQSGPLVWPRALLRTQRYSLWGAVIPAIKKTGTIISLTFAVLLKMITGKISLHSISGPIGIAQGAGITASLGLSYYLDFLGLISISLGILNMLPVPVLDGGHLLYYIIEVVQRKPLSRQAQAFGMRLGILLLIALMMLAFYNDLLRIFT